MATKKQVEKARSAVNVIADLLEGGKLGDLPEEDKALLLGLIGGAPAPAPEAAPADMPVDMELSEAAKRELAKAAASVSELAKRNAELEDRVAKMQADLELSGLVEFVKSDLSHLPSPGLSTVELAKVVGSLRRNLGADELKAVETILKAASDTIRKGGTLRAVGHSGDAPEGTPEAQLRAAAVAIRKASGDKLSISQALVEAGKSNPALWAEYKAARNT